MSNEINVPIIKERGRKLQRTGQRESAGQIFSCREMSMGEGTSTRIFHPTLTNRRRIRPVLISLHEIPSQGHTCRVCHHRAHVHRGLYRHMFVCDVVPQYTSGPGRSNQFHLPATFTWIVCRALLSLLTLSSCQAFDTPGISRMRLDARARIYPAQTLRYT